MSEIKRIYDVEPSIKPRGGRDFMGVHLCIALLSLKANGLTFMRGLLQCACHAHDS